MIQRETHVPRSPYCPGTISLGLPSKNFLIICKSHYGLILSHRTDLLSPKRKHLPSFLDLLLQLRRFSAKPIRKSFKCSTHGCRFHATQRIRVRAQCHLFPCWIYAFLASATSLSGRLMRRSMASTRKCMRQARQWRTLAHTLLCQAYPQVLPTSNPSMSLPPFPTHQGGMPQSHLNSLT